jgi:hypothetical protein
MGIASDSDRLSDVLAIMKVVSTLAQAQDDRDFDKYRSCLTDEIFVEQYPGEENWTPRTVSADEWVRGVLETLSSYEVTQHRLFNHVIEVAGDDATCVVDVTAVHKQLQGAVPVDGYTLVGRYSLKLRCEEGQWRIWARSLEYRFGEGDLPNRHRGRVWPEAQRRLEARLARQQLSP